MLTNVTRGVGGKELIQKIRVLSEFIRDNSLCGLGQSAPNPVLSTLRFFEDEYLMLLENKCPGGVCSGLLKYVINDKCKGCGNCERHCPVKAIKGELKQKYD